MISINSLPSIGQEKIIDNELDLRGLICAFWRGKFIIILHVITFALSALIYSILAHQEWTAIAITDKPTANLLGSYFSQQQFLRNLDVKNIAFPNTDTFSIAEEAYQEFLRQFTSYDSKRDFWLTSSYYRIHKNGHSHADAVLLDKLVNTIQFLPRDDRKKLSDSARLVAETAQEANQLLRHYIDFVNKRAVNHLNKEVTTTWIARASSLKAQIKRQKAVALAIYHREQLQLHQALKIAQVKNINRSRVDIITQINLPQSKIFLLGHSLLQKCLKGLQAEGPTYDTNYDQNCAMLTTLNVGPTLNNNFKTYRYLRTPEEPVERDKPRCLFLFTLWGFIGALVGGLVLLARRHEYYK